jgi:hypothetical protein
MIVPGGGISRATLPPSHSSATNSVRDVISGPIFKAGVEIPIELAAPGRPTSRGFLPWRLSDDGPVPVDRPVMGALIRNPSQVLPNALQKSRRRLVPRPDATIPMRPKPL